MVDQVRFPPSIGGSGKTYTNDANPETGVYGGGHRINFFPMLADNLAGIGYVAKYAQAIDGAKANADRAEDAKGYVEALADQYKVNILEQFKNKATLVSGFANHDFRLYDGLRTNKVADTSLWTIERATTGTYVDATGKIRTAAIDEPRYTYDPETGVPSGFLAEGQRTNLLVNSENLLAATYTVIGDTNIQSENVYSPNDAVFRIENLSAASGNYIRSPEITVTSTPGDSYTFSVLCKEGTSGAFSLRTIALGGTTQDHFHEFDFTTDSFFRDGTGTAKAKKLSNGWYLISAKISLLSGNDKVQVRLSSNAVDNTRPGSCYVAYCQIEKGADPSSYIKTTATQVTRAADSITKDVIYEVSERGFTIFCEYTPLVSDGVRFAISKGDFNNTLYVSNNLVVLRINGVMLMSAVNNEQKGKSKGLQCLCKTGIAL
ncbi:hypothetical protein CUU95_18170 [Vreelandella alkaliphila]|uniref:phage head spike fiber domain-containing protein n=1 Tax=Vreelandella alkaliphila TaxID=272774 RepID=UPI000EA2949A|nr:hypothetical protein [Halomonas alkaliphila]AYF35621.1 hypothetical protein CUU95_18170 [Halomonas alkaliphila]